MTPAQPGWYADAVYASDGVAVRYPVIAWVSVVSYAQTERGELQVETTPAALVVTPDGLFDTQTGWDPAPMANYGRARITFVQVPE